MLHTQSATSHTCSPASFHTFINLAAVDISYYGFLHSACHLADMSTAAMAVSMVEQLFGIGPCCLTYALQSVHVSLHVPQNLIRGRGVFCRSMMKSQLASPTFTPTYAALVAIINTKFPEIGELLLKRVISQVNAGCIVAVSERTKKQCRQS